jgi:tRNA (guanine37-N1)-methyltransferase
MAQRLKDSLAGVLTAEEQQSLVGSFDVIGDIAVIIIPEILANREKLIAEAILATNKNIKVVARRAGIYGGEYRTIPLSILAGEERKETEVREFGLRYRLNVETVYFSIRSGNERRRIAALVKPEESVLVLFSGIAPYPLILAQFTEAGKIVGIEKNPLAHAYAVENLRINKWQNDIILHQGDVADILPTVDFFCDRLLMPLPTMAETFLAPALRVLKPGGVLHFYDLQRFDSFHHSLAKITAACNARQRRIASFAIHKCGHCGPRTYRICIDACIL